MIRVFKITRKKYAGEAFSGKGSLLHGGRWHARGSLVVYTASSEALAALETLVHVEPSTLPDDLVILPADIPDGLKKEKIHRDELPRNWNSYPAQGLLQELGENWLSRKRSAVLCVPSAIIPTANNYLLNPEHAEFARIDIKKSESTPFVFDKRLVRKKP